MDYPAFIAAVAEMRRLQKLIVIILPRFYADTQSRLNECNAATNKVDAMLADYQHRKQVENGQLELFAENGNHDC